MSKGALFKGPPALRLAVTVAAALSVSVATSAVFAQDSRSLQDMLLAAVRIGDSAAVRSLLSAGADVAKRGPNGKTAIDVAVDNGRFEIAELLVQERRRQRDAQIAQPSAPAIPVDVEIVQQSAEAAPEVVAQRSIVLPKPALPAPPVTYVPTPKPAASTPTAKAINVQSGATVEQLLAVAQQLTLAAQNLAAAQRQSAQAAPQMPAQRDVQPARLAQPIDPDFMPKPGRKPEIEQASRATQTPNVAANTVVVTPRRRTVEEGAEQTRRDLESGQDLPVIPEADAPKTVTQPVQAAIRVTPTPPVPRVPASAPENEESDNGLVRTMRGIGGFFGIGDNKKPEPEVTPTPTHAKPGASRELMRRDRANVPHVPARRASDLQSQLAPQSQPLAQPSVQPQAQAQAQAQAMTPPASRAATTAQQLAALDAPVQAGMPPVKAVPVAPVQEQAMTIPTPSALGQLPPPNMAAPSVQNARLSVRKSNGLNPFDPDNMPQGSVLPLTDPLAGNAPEIARPKMLPETAEEKLAMASQEADLRETLRQSAAPQRTPKPAAAAVVPDVPPMPDTAKPASPTAMFERRASQPPLSAAKPTAKSEVKNLTSAVGMTSNDDEMPSDGAGTGGSERITSNRMPVLSLRGPLKDVPLTLGNSVATDQKLLPRGVAEPDPCIKRSGGTLQFCVVPVDWHPRVDPAFSLTTYLYQGSRAIARYDAGKATHYHTLFNSLAYDDVVKYFTAKYGPPTDEWKRSIAPFDQPRQPNPTLVWRSKDSRTSKVTILEVRRYDDTRNVFPDMEHGAVRLYAAGAQRVFPVISGMDLMGIDWAARSDHTDNPNDPALANTIRVGK